MAKSYENFSSALDTFNSDLVRLACEKEKYKRTPLSHLARVFNRSILEGNYRKYSERERGKFVDYPPFVDVYRSDGGSILTLTERDNRKLGLSSMFLARSPQIVRGLDSPFETFRGRDKSQESDLGVTLRVGAIMSVLYGALHPFSDANGRTAVALNGYIVGSTHPLLDKNISLDFDRFQSDTAHSAYMTLCGLAFAPKPYSIEDLFGRITEGEQVIDIVGELGQAEVRNNYLKGFLGNIEAFVDGVDWRTGEIRMNDDDFPSKDWFELGLRRLEIVSSNSLIID